MSTTEASAPEAGTAHPPETVFLPVTKIQVTGDNPRKSTDDDSQAQLNASVGELGIVSPVTVRRSDDGEGWTLLAGHRRLLAALANGLETIPALVVYEESPERRRAIAIVENLHRDPLKPMEEARAFSEATATMSQKQIADAYSISESLVRDRLALLDVPESLHPFIDDGQIPIGAAKPIATIAAHNKTLGEAAAFAVLQGKVGVGQFSSSPAWALQNAVRLWNEENNEDTVLLFKARSADLDPVEVGWTEEQISQVAETAAFVKDAYEWSSILSDEDVDAARSFGCLLEVTTNDGQVEAFVTDPEWLFEYASKGLEAKAERIRTTTDTVTTRSGRSTKAKVADLSADEKKARQEQRDKEQQARDEAIADNEKLGAQLLGKLNVKMDKRTMLLVALVLGEKWRDTIGKGIRYVIPDLRTVTEKKAGGVHVTYATAVEGYEWWHDRLMRLKTPEEIVHHIVLALAAAEFCDETAVAASHRLFASPTGYVEGGEVGDLLMAVTRSVLPARMKERALARKAEAEASGEGFTNGVPDEIVAEAKAEKTARDAADDDAVDEELEIL